MEDSGGSFSGMGVHPSIGGIAESNDLFTQNPLKIFII